MRAERRNQDDPRILKALDQVRGMIRDKYPEASFELSHSHDDPEAIHLVTMVDVEDPDEVLDLVIDRVLDLQIEDGLPLHVIPVTPPQRAIEELKEADRRRSRRGRGRSALGL